MLVTRYEVIIDDKAYGIFNAPFNSKQLTEEEQFEYYDLLDELPCPEIENAKFCFTKRGLDKFWNLVDISFKAVPKELNAKLNKTIYDINQSEIIYKDSWQVAIR